MTQSVSKPLSLMLVATALAFAAPTATSAQSMIFDEMPSAERTADLLRGARNIVSAQTGSSVITQSATAASVATPQAQQAPSPQQQASAPKRPRPAAPKRVCTTVPDSEVEFGVPVQFAINSARLPSKFRAGLGRLAEAMSEVPEASIEIGGHTDVSGGDGVNMPLSQKRAAAVFTALVQDFGVDPSRLRVVGYGSSRLCTPNEPRDSVNRRVGFRILQNAG